MGIATSEKPLLLHKGWLIKGGEMKDVVWGLAWRCALSFSMGLIGAWLILIAWLILVWAGIV